MPRQCAPELVQLRQTEAFGVLDDKHRGIRHIDATSTTRWKPMPDLAFLKRVMTSLFPPVSCGHGASPRRSPIGPVCKPPPPRAALANPSSRLSTRVDDVGLASAELFPIFHAWVPEQRRRLVTTSGRPRQLADHRHAKSP